MKKGKEVFILMLLFSCLSSAQQQDKFVIGAYMHNTPWPRDGYFMPHDSSLFSLWRAHALGINTAMVYVRQPYSDNDINYIGPYTGVLLSNMDSLRSFRNVVAMNTFASHGVLDGAETEFIRNFDYVFFYSGAYYSRWDATQEIVYLGTLGLKHDYGYRKTIGGKVYWSTHDEYGNPPEVPDGEPWFVRGPNYLQETRYRGSWTNNPQETDLQTYEVNFHLKLGAEPIPEEMDDPVCQILVYVKYKTGENILQDSLISSDLTAGDIWTSENGNKLRYNYADFCRNAFKLTDAVYCPEGKELIDVEFRVQYYDTGHELLIDYIEVYDIDIWFNRLYYEVDKNQAREKIANYLNKFRTANPQFYENNLKYIFSVDEPHSVDCLIPQGFVQSVLESIKDAWGYGPTLLTHLYPEWDGYRNEAAVLPPWVEEIKPKPLNFYYAPYGYDISTQVGLNVFKNIFKCVYEANSKNGLMEDFYYTIQLWDLENHWLHWRQPNPEELNAGVMLALSHGAKGIFYEPFYDNEDGDGGLLEYDSQGLYEPKAIGIHVRDHINPRLSGTLGNTLLKLKYTGQDICLRKGAEVSCGENNYYDYLKLYDSSVDTCDFNAAFLKDTLDQDNNYFMVVNSFCRSSRELRMELDFSNSSYNNLKVKNVEGGLDTTFYSHNEDSIDYNFPPGEGYLFQVSPVVKYGGKLLFNETISAAVELNDNLIIYSNAALTVTGTYNLYDTLIINQGGSLVVNGGRINVYDGGAIINNGTMTTANNAELKFSEGICLRNNSYLNASGTLFSALSNSWGGIYFAANSSGMINSSTVEKVTAPGGAAITINDASPTVRYTTIQNCWNGINIHEESEPVILGNIILNTAENGIYVENSHPYIGVNTIEGGDSSAAVRCYNASPWFISAETWEEGGNTLRNGYYGVYAYNNSTVYMGDIWEFYHLNRIIDNTYYAYAGNSSVIYAQLDWWGTDKPEESLFITGGESFIYYDPYLTEDPLEGFLQEGEGNYSLLSGQLITAKKLVSDSSYQQAAEIYKAIVTNYPDSAQAVIALTELQGSLRKNK